MTFSGDEIYRIAYWIVIGLSAGLVIDFFAAAFWPKIKELFFSSATVAGNAVGWNVRDILLAAALYCVLQSGFGILILAAHKADLLSYKMAHILSILWATFGVNLLVIGCVLIYLRWRYAATSAELGFQTAAPFRKIILGALGYLGFLPLFFVLIFISALICQLLGIEPKAHVVVDLFRTEKNPWILGSLVFFAALGGPVIEEIFFRGFVYNALKKKWGVKVGLIVTALFFAAVHGNAFQFLPILGLGLLLTYLYEATGSLLASITLHALNNSVSVALAFTLLKSAGE